MLTACIKPDSLKEAGTPANSYFDIKGLIDTQITLLQNSQVQVSKHTSVNGKEEALSAANVNWKKELGLFADADINKPILSQSYKTDTLKTSLSQTLVHTALEDGLRVRRIEVMQNPMGQAMMLNIDFQEHNPMYEAEQHLYMTLDSGKAVTYQLKGFQKMQLQDTLMYHVEATVIWPDK